MAILTGSAPANRIIGRLIENFFCLPFLAINTLKESSGNTGNPLHFYEMGVLHLI